MQATAVGDAMSAFLVLRAFSWQLCLSPVTFEEVCAALDCNDPTPLADEIFTCLLRGLAHDENKEARSKRKLDLGNLDHVTWPEYVWEWLWLSHSPLARLRGPGAEHQVLEVHILLEGQVLLVKAEKHALSNLSDILEIKSKGVNHEMASQAACKFCLIFVLVLFQVISTHNYELEYAF